MEMVSLLIYMAQKTFNLLYDNLFLLLLILLEHRNLDRVDDGKGLEESVCYQFGKWQPSLKGPGAHYRSWDIHKNH